MWSSECEYTAIFGISNLLILHFRCNLYFRNIIPVLFQIEEYFSTYAYYKYTYNVRHALKMYVCVCFKNLLQRKKF